ncbi:hypothetical protein K2X30_07150 [bacterium]|jgi:hypothetical protein|nr:hypothetical protein [bacterium]
MRFEVVLASLLLLSPPSLADDAAERDSFFQRIRSKFIKATGNKQPQEVAQPAAPAPDPSAVAAQEAAKETAKEKSLIFADKACTFQESWNETPKFTKDFWKELSSLTSGKSSPAFGFSQALAYRNIYREPEGKLLTEYWISRALLQAKLYHIAYYGFTAVVAAPLRSDTMGIQLAALTCLNHIIQKYPSFELPQAVTTSLADYASVNVPKKLKTPLLEYALLAAIDATSERTSKTGADWKESELRSLAKVLKGSGAYENLVTGIWAARRLNYPQSVRELEKFIAIPDKPASLAHFNDRARLILARSYYSNGQYDKATLQLRAISKGSNDLAEVLSELAWSELMTGNYTDAIGAATSLQAGGLIHTFSPEGPMVMAMALNEICQYPDSLQTIQIFQKDYVPVYNWLSGWMRMKQGKKSLDLYKMAVNFLKKKSDVPPRIGTQWIRSPIFISHQEEINLMFDEKEAVLKLGKAGSAEQKKLAADLLAQFNVLRPKIAAAKKKMVYGDSLPDKILSELADLKRKITLYRRYRDAAPVWRAILANYQKKVRPREAQLLASINKELNVQTESMLVKLEEIAENNQLIEVEIYNGATQDIIWQNAHPDYKKVAQEMAKESGEVASAKVWDWGKAPTSNADEAQEVWEDELGSFKARTFDNCNSKDRYLALKKKDGGKL